MAAATERDLSQPIRFEQLSPGVILRVGPRRVSAEEIVEFARRYDPQPFHVDPTAAAASRWGGLIASGWMTCGIAMDLLARHLLPGSGSIGSPGIDELRWEHPVRPGDDLSLAVTVIESRIASSRKTGIVKWRWELHNQAQTRTLSLIAISLFELSVEPERAG